MKVEVKVKSQVSSRFFSFVVRMVKSSRARNESPRLHPALRRRSWDLRYLDLTFVLARLVSSFDSLLPCWAGELKVNLGR